MRTKWAIRLVVMVVFGFANVTLAAERQADFSAWPNRMPIKLVYANDAVAGMLPVDVTFSLKADTVAADPRQDLRLVYESDGKMMEVPFQLSRLTTWTKDTDGDKSVVCVNGMITFFDISATKPAGMYYILSGNEKATAQQYETDLKVTGEGPAWRIENDLIYVELREADEVKADVMGYHYGASGQLAQVTVKAHPDVILTNANRALHWNPGIFVPTRGWMHAYAWNPPDKYEIEQGPLYVEVRRSGQFPNIPEARLAITYRFFTHRDFVWVGTRVDVIEDLGVVALRNDQLVFDRPTFTHVAWCDGGRVHDKALADCPPVNDHGDILRFGPEIPYLALYNPTTGVGAATVRMDIANIGPEAGVVTQFDNATYLSAGHGKETFIYWFRPQNYFRVGWDRKQLITVPAGTTYAERNLYVFYDTTTEGNIGHVKDLTRAVRHQPDIQYGEPPFPGS
ncbi:MAG: hypothetical protein JW709_13510 [Sedimentisphaerales bacterium]|nr:hypothetical protein [Sedimentisphaerales bacterium]